MDLAAAETFEAGDDNIRRMTKPLISKVLGKTGVFVFSFVKRFNGDVRLKDVDKEQDFEEKGVRNRVKKGDREITSPFLRLMTLLITTP